MITAIIILSVLLVISLFIIRNLLFKLERLEDINEYQQIYMNNLDEVIRNSSEKIKEIDAKGTFKSDDEIGWFFKYILYIQQLLDNFKLLNHEEIKEIERGKNRKNIPQT